MTKRSSIATFLWQGEIPIEVHRKAIKHSYLRIKAQPARVVCSLPRAVSDMDLRVFLQKHSDWIQARWQAMQQNKPVEVTYQQGERIFFWGKPFFMEVQIMDGVKKPSCFTRGDHLVLQSGVALSPAQREALVYEFFRQEFKKELSAVLEQEALRMGVSVQQWGIKRMKTRWGSCNPKAKRVWLNLELVKREQYLLRYVVIHELAHLLVPNHSPKFYQVMDQYCPPWKVLRKQLRF